MNAALPPPIWTTGSTEVFKTGTWRAALPRHVRVPSPCHQACPVGGEIADWIGRARAQDLRGAWQVLTRHNPFPAIAGRICHHPCEAACNRQGFDEAVSICRLERHVGDAAIAAGWGFEAPQAERDGHVAVIGAGPAGLSAAFQLRRRGWRVTVFEASEAPGGLMRHGIPAYRLAREVLDAEIARLLALGITIRCGTPVSTPEAFEQLCAGHDAVFVATGAARVKRLPVLDPALPGVMDGAAYLAAANAGRAPALGRRVVVIGGGSAALDAARSARRAGHAVTVLALEAREQMPAQREEVDEALDEGLEIVNGAMLTGCEATPAGLRLHGTAVRFAPGAARGSFTVQPIDGTAFELRADAVLVSIGQDPELGILGDTLAHDGGLLAADTRQATARDGVWAGGDVASLERYVTEAVGMGQAAALDIHRVLLQRSGTAQAADWHGSEHAAGARVPSDAPTGRAGRPPAVATGPLGETPAGADELPSIDRTVTLQGIATWYHEPAARAPVALRPAEERVRGHDEVQLPLTVAQALAEAGRCFSCGSCVHCDNCVIVCPDLAVVRRPDVNGAPAGYTVLGDYCKGCGLCVRECPTGSMTMQEEAR
mgnify:CR=1 FL=1